MNSNLRHKNKNVLHGVVMSLLRAHHKAVREELVKINITEGKPKIIDFLYVNSGCSQKEVASSCHIEPATVTSILNAMESEALIYRERNPLDKRVYNVFLTDKGRDTYQQVDKAFNTIDDISFSGFTAEEKQQTLAYLNRIRENLAQHYSTKEIKE